MERGSTGFVLFGAKLAPMGLDDCLANRETETETALLRGPECLENIAGILRKATPVVAH